MSLISGFATKFISKENLRVFALWALRLLEEQLDTEAKPRLEKYRADRASLETQTQTVLGEIKEREARLAQLVIQRSATEQRIASNEAKIQQSQQEVKQIDEETDKVDSLSDDDVLHAGVRRNRG